MSAPKVPGPLLGVTGSRALIEREDIDLGREKGVYLEPVRRGERPPTSAGSPWGRFRSANVFVVGGATSSSVSQLITPPVVHPVRRCRIAPDLVHPSRGPRERRPDFDEDLAGMVSTALLLSRQGAGSARTSAPPAARELRDGLLHVPTYCPMGGPPQVGWKLMGIQPLQDLRSPPRAARSWARQSHLLRQLAGPVVGSASRISAYLASLAASSASARPTSRPRSPRSGRAAAASRPRTTTARTIRTRTMSQALPPPRGRRQGSSTRGIAGSAGRPGGAGGRPARSARRGT